MGYKKIGTIFSTLLQGKITKRLQIFLKKYHFGFATGPRPCTLVYVTGSKEARGARPEAQTEWVRLSIYR